MSMVDTTRAELQARKGDWMKLSEAVPGITYSWITKFAQGRIENPGARKLEALQAYFLNQPNRRSAA